MDPNEALNCALDRAKVILEGEDDAEGLGAGEDRQTDEARELAEYFLALHEWISKGGFLPEGWTEPRDSGKYFVKARVYGTIAAKYTETLKAILGTVDDSSHTSRGLAREALEWRHSEKGGVPMKAIEVVGELLNASMDRCSSCEAHYKRAEDEKRQRLALIASHAMKDIEQEGAKREIAELKKRIESGMAAHNEERVARDWLAREKERLEGVIRTGGAMYRAERAKMGIPGGIDAEQDALFAELRTLAEEVLANKTRSHVQAATIFARHILGK